MQDLPIAQRPTGYEEFLRVSQTGTLEQARKAFESAFGSYKARHDIADATSIIFEKVCKETRFQIPVSIDTELKMIFRRNPIVAEVLHAKKVELETTAQPRPALAA
ncbi:MAG: hypothetical protein AAF549_08045 [Pseudomonadota bacterium]